MFEMLGNIIINIFSKPATRLYPEEERRFFKGIRGHMSIDIEKCTFCGICSEKCLSKALNINSDLKIWEIDPFRCIVCNACKEVCPENCIRTDEQYTHPAFSKEKLKYVQCPKFD